MASEIAIIKVPAPIVTLQQFAELEGVSERTAYPAYAISGIPHGQYGRQI